MRKLLLCLLIVFIGTLGKAQIEVPDIIPASPEATAFMRASLGNVNFSTGAVTSQIPLYQLKVHDYTLPISLSYSSQGMRVDEASSRAGINWSLQAGGMISRTVRGIPDELAYTRPGMPVDFFADNASNYEYFKDASNTEGTVDTQKDEYYFGFNGYSGKYVYNDNNEAVCLSNENLKISNDNGMNFQTTITTPDGVKYIFGQSGDFEKTTKVITRFGNTGIGNISSKQFKTVLFLSKIELVNGASIWFNYSSININLNTGISQTKTMYNNGNDQPCPECGGTSGSTTTSMSGMSYASKYLTGITTSAGETVDFVYEDRPDETGDNRFTAINIFANGQYTRKYKFDYYDLSDGSGGALTGRYFLTRLSKAEKLVYVLDDPETTKWQHYLFRYHDMENAALPITEKQDHYGFYNGVDGLLPSFGPFNRPDYSKRESHPGFAMKGVLSAIVYPTGGTEEFFYGPNTVPSIEKRQTFKSVSVSGTDSGPLWEWNHSTTFQTETTFQVKRNHTARLDIQSFPNVNYDSSYPTGWDIKEMVNVRVLRAVGDIMEGDIPYAPIPGGGPLVYSDILRGHTFLSTEIQLEAGCAYIVEITVKGGWANGGSAILTYDTARQDYYDYKDKIVSGVRLEQIRYTDSIAKISHNKYYKYARTENTMESSGMGGGTVSGYSYTSFREIACTDNPLITEYKLCTSLMYLSSTKSNLFNLDGSHIYYTHILESDDPEFKNGGTEYTFYAPETNKTIIASRGTYGGIGDDAYGDTHINLGGLLHKARHFNAQMQIEQETINEYEIVEGGTQPAYSFYATQAFIPLRGYLYAESMQSFTAALYAYENKWKRLKSTTTRIYENNNLVNESLTTYSYDLPVNVNPIEIITSNSKGELLKKTNTFPTNYPSNVVLTTMVNQNMIAFPVEEASYKETTLLQKKEIVYKDWFNDGKVIQPDTTKLQSSPSSDLQPEIIYSSYDLKGNPLEFQKAGNIPLTYLWAYNDQYPIVEIKNAKTSEIYFNSFEESNEGTFDAQARTGIYSRTGSYIVNFTLPAGTTRSFVITYWVYNGSKWLLQSSPYSGPVMTITGSRIDDIRIHPADAIMTTYTYQPQLGITSVTDENNRTLYYEYDEEARLHLVRDQDNNIIKMICYNYAGQAQDCGYKPANWEATGNYRCIKDGANNNNGMQEKEEKDMEMESATYNQFRWLENGQNLTGCPLPYTCNTSNCSGPTKKCINNVCETACFTCETVPIGDRKYQITFYYKWSDGSSIYSHQEISTAPCLP